MSRPSPNAFPRKEKHEQFNLVVFEKNGRHFELDVEPDNAIAFKQGKNIDLNSVLKSKYVFFNMHKGEFASPNELKTVFGTDDIDKIAMTMLKEGEIQLSEKYREEIRAKLYTRLVGDIHRLAIDARSELPLPTARIENALEEVKFKIKENIRYDITLRDALDAIKVVIPLKITNLQCDVYFDIKYSDQLLNYFQNVGTVIKKEVQQTRMHAVVEIPSGLRDELVTNINEITHAAAKIEIAKK